MSGPTPAAEKDARQKCHGSVTQSANLIAVLRHWQPNETDAEDNGM